MKTVFHKSEDRGHANHGWLNSFHSFSFANWYNPERMNFGALRVLNDDEITGGTGFPSHPHRDMEIISIPLSGVLEHEDSMGNKKQIQSGEVQVMTAGTGVVHSEYNASKSEKATFLQIWIFPNKNGLKPHYSQQKFDENQLNNKLFNIVSPSNSTNGVVTINQNAWMYRGKFSEKQEINYHFKSENQGAYLFVLNGNITINNQTLNKRDAYGVWATSQFSFSVEPGSEVLLIDVPMRVNL